MLKKIYAVTCTTVNSEHSKSFKVIKGFEDEDRAILFKEKLGKVEDGRWERIDKCFYCKFNGCTTLPKSFERFSRMAKAKCSDADFVITVAKTPEYNTIWCQNLEEDDQNYHYYYIEEMKVEMDG